MQLTLHALDTHTCASLARGVVDDVHSVTASRCTAVLSAGCRAIVLAGLQPRTVAPAYLRGTGPMAPVPVLRAREPRAGGLGGAQAARAKGVPMVPPSRMYLILRAAFAIAMSFVAPLVLF